MRIGLLFSLILCFMLCGGLAGAAETDVWVNDHPVPGGFALSVKGWPVPIRHDP